jgi:hypothetical protein
MADALDEAGCRGIEFFAVPASDFNVIYPANFLLFRWPVDRV